MSELASQLTEEKRREAEFAPVFKSFVRAHLIKDIVPRERSGKWLVDAKGQLFPTPVNYVGFIATDLDPFTDDPEEHIADDGQPKQDMLVTIGYLSRAAGQEVRNDLYGLHFYERAVGDTEAESAFSLYVLNREELQPAVSYEIADRLMTGILDLKVAGKMQRLDSPE